MFLRPTVSNGRLTHVTASCNSVIFFLIHLQSTIPVSLCLKLLTWVYLQQRIPISLLRLHFGRAQCNLPGPNSSSVLFASVLTHWWLPIKWCSRKAPRFSLQHSSWKHLNKQQKFCSLMLMNILDPVLCFIKFQLIFLLFLSSSCSAAVSQSFCVLTAPAL